MIDYRNLIKNRELRLKIIKCLSFIPNAPYLKMVYKIKTGKKLCLSNPIGYNEKLQWLKLHDKRAEYTNLVDKIKVREIIKERLGEEYLIPVLGSWDTFEDINFDELPNQFVLKCSHDSGSVKIIQDKASLTKKDIANLAKFYKGRLSLNSYCLSREYPYKDVKPRVIAEQFMKTSGDSDGGIKDYKFFCFGGIPKLLLVISGRRKKDEGGYHEDFFDMDYNRLPIRNGYTETPDIPEKPKNFEQMKEIAAILSKDIPHVRMDFYEINERIYFGEFTFFTSGGFILFEPDEWEKRLGSWINIDNLK